MYMYIYIYIYIYICILQRWAGHQHWGFNKNIDGMVPYPPVSPIATCCSKHGFTFAI